jgi:hypothetical protein
MGATMLKSWLCAKIRNAVGWELPRDAILDRVEERFNELRELLRQSTETLAARHQDTLTQHHREFASLFTTATQVLAEVQASQVESKGELAEAKSALAELRGLLSDQDRAAAQSVGQLQVLIETQAQAAAAAEAAGASTEPRYPSLVGEVNFLLSWCHELYSKADVDQLIHDQLFPRLAWTLSHPEFLELDRPLQKEFLRVTFALFVCRGHRKAPLVGRLVSLLWEKYLRRPDFETLWLLDVYDAQFGLYCAVSGELLSMLPFDEKVVRPLAARVRRESRPSINAGPRDRRPETGLRIAYFLHYALQQRGNSVAPVYTAMLRRHAAQTSPTHEIFLYCVQWFDQEFLQTLADLPITIRTFSSEPTTNDVLAIRTALEADGIDVILTEVPSSRATWLFEQRVAPLQFLLELGYPFWSIENVDWMFLADKSHRDWFGVDPRKCSSITLGHECVVIDQAPPPESVAEARRAFPPEATIFGAWARFIKFSPAYLAIVERILLEQPNAWWLIGGNGDPTVIDDFLAHTPVADRIRFHRGQIDVPVYGRVIDVFADTFPYCGGVGVWEVCLFGKPVLSMFAPDWDQLMRESRDPELMVHTADDYCQRAARLIADRDYYRDRSQAALEIGCRRTDPSSAIDEINRVIAQLWPQRFPQPTAQPRAPSLPGLRDGPNPSGVMPVSH